MGGALVHGQRGDLLVGLAAVVAVVRLARRVDHVVLVQAGVLSEALLAAGHGAHVWLLTCQKEPEVSEGQEPGAFRREHAGRWGLTGVYPHVVLVVGGAGEGPAATGLGAVVRPLAGVRPDVDFADVGCGERPATAFDRAFEGLLSCRTRGDKELILQLKYFHECQNKLIEQ